MRTVSKRIVIKQRLEMRNASTLFNMIDTDVAIANFSLMQLRFFLLVGVVFLVDVVLFLFSC